MLNLIGMSGSDVKLKVNEFTSIYDILMYIENVLGAVHPPKDIDGIGVIKPLQEQIDMAYNFMQFTKFLCKNEEILIRNKWQLVYKSCSVLKAYYVYIYNEETPSVLGRIILKGSYTDEDLQSDCPAFRLAARWYKTYKSYMDIIKSQQPFAKITLKEV